MTVYDRSEYITGYHCSYFFAYKKYILFKREAL